MHVVSFLREAFTRFIATIRGTKREPQSLPQSQNKEYRTGPKVAGPKVEPPTLKEPVMSKADKIREIANRLGTKPEWLDALINFETAGTYDPQIKNPYSSARGLIQVIDSTARSDFNVSDSLSLVRKYPSFNAQMENVVYPYLAKYAPFRSKQELYMAVFYPAYRKASPDTIFPEEVRRVNKNITKVQDYVDFVDRRVKKETLALRQKATNIGIVLIAGAGLYFLMRRGGMA